MIDTTHIDWLKHRLKQPLPGSSAQALMAFGKRRSQLVAPPEARDSAVLGLFFPKEEELNLLLIKRVEDGKAHGGQISFPGGRKDAEDIDLQYTALRETHEEVGIAANDIEIIGELSSLYIPVSNSKVHPFIGYTPHKPDYILSVDEVQYVIELPVNRLFDPSIKMEREIRPSSHPQLLIKAPAYQPDEEHTIWGATAMILSELETIIKEYDMA